MPSKIKDSSIIAELKRIAAKNGGILMPEEVVKEAQHEDSPLHDHFDWNDDEAAYKWRLLQARQLINVVVEFIKPNGEPVETRVFVSLKQDREEGGYRSIIAVLKNNDLRAQLVQDALDAMQYFKSKYKDLVELGEVFSAMSAAERRLVK